MIKLAENINELDFLPADPFAAVIRALAETYGANEVPFVRIAVQQDKAALCSVDGNVTVCALEGADFEELSLYLKATGFLSVKGERSVIERLGFPAADGSFIVEFIPNEYPAPENFTAECDIGSAYKLLFQAGFTSDDFGAFKADICARLNKATAKFGGIVEDGSLLATCFRLFEGDKSILLGAVVTDIKARGRGLASALVPYMASPEKPSFLFCRQDSLLRFYENCGFRKCGEWALAKGGETQ